MADQERVRKVGRNQACPCRSGQKFKRCCGAVATALPDRQRDEALMQALRAKQAEIAQKEDQQGLGRGIMSGELGGRRFVFVGDRCWHSARWITFHDFLDEYLVHQLGIEWYKDEMKKPHEQRHRIVRWRVEAFEEMKRTATTVGRLSTGVMNGTQQAYLNLAYNIYLIAHHAPIGGTDQLIQSFVTRLRSSKTDEFTGKLFETYAAAMFLKAGFRLEYEDEADGTTSHVEFVATYPVTGRKFSVEVKSRNPRGGDPPAGDDYRHIRVNYKLAAALKKKAAHTRIVMIEINVKDILTRLAMEGWPRAASEQVQTLERTRIENGEEIEPAYVLVTNHTFHNNPEIPASLQAVFLGYGIPDFGPHLQFSSLKEYLDIVDRHKEVNALITSMKTHYRIPETFDGQNPELVFGKNVQPPLKIGNRYLIPMEDGSATPAVLQTVCVREKERQVMGGYQTDAGTAVLATTPLSDAEFRAWRRHPKTFFGEIREVPNVAETWLHMAIQLYQSYKDSRREQLLQMVSSFPDAAELAKLSQRDLAVEYCDRISKHVFYRETKPKPA